MCLNPHHMLESTVERLTWSFNLCINIPGSGNCFNVILFILKLQSILKQRRLETDKSTLFISFYDAVRDQMRNFFSAIQILFMIFVWCHQMIFFQISRLLNLFSSAQNNKPKQQQQKQTNPKTDKLIVAGDKLENLLQSLLMWGTFLVYTQTLARKIKSSCQIYQEICPCHEASCLTSHSLTVKDFIINLPHLILHKITRLNDISLNSNLDLMLFLKTIQCTL